MVIPTYEEAKSKMWAAAASSGSYKGKMQHIIHHTHQYLLEQIIPEINRLGKCCPADGSRYTAFADLPAAYGSKIGGRKKYNTRRRRSKGGRRTRRRR